MCYLMCILQLEKKIEHLNKVDTDVRNENSRLIEVKLKIVCTE